MVLVVNRESVFVKGVERKQERHCGSVDEATSAYRSRRVERVRGVDGAPGDGQGPDSDEQVRDRVLARCTWYEI